MDICITSSKAQGTSLKRRQKECNWLSVGNSFFPVEKFPLGRGKDSGTKPKSPGNLDDWQGLSQGYIIRKGKSPEESLTCRASCESSGDAGMSHHPGWG